MGAFARWRSSSPSSPPGPPAPFIVGVARSGTTLLRLALDAHPELAVPAETGFLLPWFAASRWRLPRPSREEFLRRVTGFHTFPDCGLDAERFAREVAALDPFSLAEGVRSFYRLYAATRGKPRWGDKTPSYGQVLRRLRALLPEARFIHLIRDGRDVALSLARTWFAPGRDLTTLAAHWAREVEGIRNAGAGNPAYLEIRFEELVVAPRATLERIAGFLDLPYSEAMEGYHRSAAERLSEVQDLRLSSGEVVTRDQRLHQHHRTSSPPDVDRVGVWRREMTPGDVEVFERVAGAALARLGYEVRRRSHR